jgi:hypothetical protein
MKWIEAEGKNRTLARNIAPWRRWAVAGTDEAANYELPIALESSPQLPIRRKRDRAFS